MMVGENYFVNGMNVASPTGKAGEDVRWAGGRKGMKWNKTGCARQATGREGLCTNTIQKNVPWLILRG